MAQRIIKPMSYGDIFDELFDLYKKHFALFFGISAVVFIPVYVLAYALGGVSAYAVSMVAGGLLNYLVIAATTYAVSQCYLGNTTTIAESYKAVGRKIVPFLITMIGVGIIIGAGLLLLVIPGLIFAFWYAFISEVYILEDKTGREARDRSKELAAGNWDRIFVLGLLSFILMAIVSAVFELPLGLIPSAGMMAGGISGLAEGILTGLAATLTTPIQVMAFVLLYYDIRVRKEGFDIRMLASNMGIADAQLPTPQDETPRI